MDPAALMRRFFSLINTSETDEFVELLADDFVEHERRPGWPPVEKEPGSCSR